MSAELTPDVVDRLTSADYGWLTTVAKSGQPVVGGEATVDAEGVSMR